MNTTNLITLNAEQQSFVALVAQQESCCLVGAAGTGKTTAVKEAISTLLDRNLTPTITAPTGSPNNPRLRTGIAGIVGCAFTRRAVANLRKNFPEELHDHCMTIHALIEFQPVNYEVLDEESGSIVTKMRFEPQRNKLNPLPHELTTIIIEEASMVGTDLFGLLLDAIPPNHKVQFVFLGDINQLAPVFGDSILGYKLLDLPTIQLTHVYRQALESPIIRLAHRIISGKQILYPELSKPEAEGGEWQVEDKLTILNWKPKMSEWESEATAIAYLKREYLAGNFDPLNDMVLIPFNKAFGTVNLSKGIANFMDAATGKHPTEIIAGYQKQYFCVGDLVLHKNEEYVIAKIAPNMRYTGKPARNYQYHFDRFGNPVGKKGATVESQPEFVPTSKSAEQIIDDLIAGTNDTTQEEASHNIYLVRPGSIFDAISRVVKSKLGEENALATLTPEQLEDPATLAKVLTALDITYEKLLNTMADRPDMVSSEVCNTRGTVNYLSLAYASTCHKAQGLEARKVFIIVHRSHGVLTTREWLYTAVTRAKEHLVILCERDTFMTGINKQQIKGTTLADKAEYFKGKQQAKASLESNRKVAFS